MWRRSLLAGLVALASVALVACGSDNSSTTATPMTAQQYTQFIKRLSQQEDQAHHSLDQALHSKNASQIQQGVQAFAADQTDAANRRADP